VAVTTWQGCQKPAYPRPGEASGGGDAKVAVVLVKAELVQNIAFDCSAEKGETGNGGKWGSAVCYCAGLHGNAGLHGKASLGVKIFKKTN
jgi:hypothetical protein